MAGIDACGQKIRPLSPPSYASRANFQHLIPWVVHVTLTPPISRLGPRSQRLYAIHRSYTFVFTGWRPLEKRVGAIESTASAPTMGWGGTYAWHKRPFSPAWYPPSVVPFLKISRRPNLCAPKFSNHHQKPINQSHTVSQKQNQ